MAMVELLDRDVYSSVEAARLLGVPVSTLRRWLHGHDRAGRLQSIRPFVIALRESLGVPYPLAHARPWVHDRQLVMRIQQETGLDERLAFVEYSSGQLVLSPVAEAFFHKVEFDPDERIASRLYPAGRSSPVVIDPRLSWGEPTVSGIRTDNIYELWLAGDDPDRIASAFDLPADQVQAALRFEADPDRVRRMVA